MPSVKIHPRHSEENALEQRGYLIGKQIGQGSYATVHIAQYINVNNNNNNNNTSSANAGANGVTTNNGQGTTNQCSTAHGGAGAASNLKRPMPLACKIFDKDRAPRDFLQKFFPRELEILTQIDHPHIIQVHSILQRGGRVFIFMRFAENGDLLDYIKRNSNIPEGQARIWFGQMASGLQYLHSRNIAHRDLKCENILLSARFNVKLADFGFARFCTDSSNRRILSQTYCGSAAYAAPEVVNGSPYNPKISDVWSLGVVLYIMLNANMPFDDSDLRTLLRNQMAKKWFYRSKLKNVLSASAKHLMSALLEPDITIRPTVERVLRHEWVRGRTRDAPPPSSSSNATKPTSGQPAVKYTNNTKRDRNEEDRGGDEYLPRKKNSHIDIKLRSLKNT